MKDWTLILGRARMLVRGGADHAGAISAALAERRYTYGHPADYLRVVLKIDAHLRYLAAMPRIGPVKPPPGYRPAAPTPLAQLPPAPRDEGRAAIRRRVYADRYLPGKNAPPKPPTPAVAARIITRAGGMTLAPEDHAIIRPDRVTPGQQQAIGASLERMAGRPRPPASWGQRRQLAHAVNARRQ